MNICQVVFEFPMSTDEPIVSGEIKNPYYLTRSLQRRGHNVVVLSSPAITHDHPEVRCSVQTDGIETHWLRDGYLKGVFRYGSRSFRSLPRRLLDLHEREKFDVVHFHSPSLALSSLCLKKRGKLTLPLVVTAHGTYVPELQALLGGERWLHDRLVAIDSWAMHRLDRVAFKYVDKAISVSDFQVNEMRDIYHMKNHQIKVIRNGVDVDHFKPDPNNGQFLREKLGIYTKNMVLFVGRLVRKKGLRFLFDAAKKVESLHPSTSLVVVGGTNEFALHGEEIRLLARERKIRNLRFEMNVSEKDLPVYYNAADVCITPSIDYESIPTVIYEAMACGKPVVATRKWGIKEIQTDPRQVAREKDAADIAKKINFLLSNPILCREIGERNRFIATSQFSWEKATGLHERLYREVMK